MTIGFVDYVSPERLLTLPKGQGASAAIQHKGGACPVHPLQPISVWWRNPRNSEWWVSIDTASTHDWSKPCVYRIRTPRAGHPMLREARREKMEAQTLVIATPIETIAQDFTRLVDAIENYLARCN